MNTLNESHDFPRIRITRETRQLLKLLAVQHDMTMQDYLAWLARREMARNAEASTLPERQEP